MQNRTGGMETLNPGVLRPLKWVTIKLMAAKPGLTPQCRVITHRFVSFADHFLSGPLPLNIHVEDYWNRPKKCTTERAEWQRRYVEVFWSWYRWVSRYSTKQNKSAAEESASQITTIWLVPSNISDMTDAAVGNWSFEVQCSKSNLTWKWAMDLQEEMTKKVMHHADQRKR